MATEIDWTYLVIEMLLLAGIIFGVVYVDRWHYLRALRKENQETQDRIRNLIVRDLERKLEIIQQTYDHKRVRPLFISIWDSILFTGKQGLLPFELFDRLHRTYSLMRYYNSEIEKLDGSDLEGHMQSILSELTDAAKESLAALKTGRDL
jgi:hypothetical protein